MWVDPGATATDAEDGDLTDKIVRDASQLDTATPGVYRVAYSVVDSAGCETRAVRYVRVIALVATSDAAYLSTLCMRQVPRVTMTCEVGMQRHEDHRPNPAAFPACCLLAQEMDASACFCDGRVVGELNVRNATFFNDLVDFTPMACGFKIKTGEVCTDMRALERFFSEEIVDTGEEVATVEELITEGGALNAELPCNEQIEAVTAMCQRLTRATPGPAPLVSDFVPCCTAASVLNVSECLCDENFIFADETRTTFLQQLIGFAPLGCGFALTGTCPAITDRLDLPSVAGITVPDAFSSESVPEVLPVAGGWNTSATTWEFLFAEDDAVTVDDTGGEQAFWVQDGGTQLFNLISCAEYVSLAPQVCGGVRLNSEVSTLELTECCALLHAAHAKGCLCPPAGLAALASVNPDLTKIAPVACALNLDTIPSLGEGSCKTRLTLEHVMSPAESQIFAEKKTAGDGSRAQVDFFDERDLQLGTFIGAAPRATPIVVTTPTTIEVAGVNDTSVKSVVPPGSVFGVVAPEVMRTVIDTNIVESVIPGTLSPGETYVIPADTIVTSDVTSLPTYRASESNSSAGGAVALEAGGDEWLLLTVPDLSGVVKLPWTASLAPVPVIPEANYAEDRTDTLPVVVVTNRIDGVTSLVPLASDGRSYETVKADVAEAEGDADNEDYENGYRGLIYGNGNETGVGNIVRGSTTSCLFAVVIAEASCIPMLESVSEIFELDIGWRVCCSRISAVNDDGCFCDGAVTAALEVTARSNIHARVMDAIPGACGFQLTSGDSCPSAIFAESESGDKINVTTSDPNRELVFIHADVYAAPEVISSVTAAGAVVVSSNDASRDDAEVADNVAAEGLSGAFDADTGLVTLTLPGDATVTADVAVFYPNEVSPSSVTSPPPPGPSPTEIIAVDPEDPSRPLPGYGVVTSDGVVVPALEIDDDAISGPCDAVRMLKNFLTTSLEPGMESFVVMGAITHCKGFPLEVPEVVLPVMYRPRGGDGGYAAPLSEPDVECLGITLISNQGEVLLDNLCDRFSFETREYGVDLIIRDVSICVDCALTGRASDGAIARVSHPRSDTLNAMQPSVTAMTCDVDAIAEEDRRRRLLELPRDGRKLLQFLAEQYSNPMEVNDFFSRMRPGGGESGSSGDEGSSGKDSGYALIGDEEPRDPQETRDPPSPDLSPAPPQIAPSDGQITCQDDVNRLAGNVQWWSRGSGPLEPGLPNQPYDEYVFSGSIDALAGDAGADLRGIVLPIVFSPWVLDDGDGGNWRAVLDPASELEVECAGIEKIPGDGSDESTSDESTSDEPCGGVTFALSTYSSLDANGGEGQETPATGDSAPAVLLLEVSFDGVGTVDAGGKVAGSGPRGEMFRVRHVTGASLDFVGPTVGALECAPGGVVGTIVAGVAPSSPTTEQPAPGAGNRGGVVVSGDDRDVSSCAGRPGLNLKGELLNDGGASIKDEAADCCRDCVNLPECNVWVYCEGDCVDYAYHSCWLKRATVMSDTSAPDAWAASPNVPWTSGWFPPKEGVEPAPMVEDDEEPEAPEDPEEPEGPEEPEEPEVAPPIRVVPVPTRPTEPIGPTDQEPTPSPDPTATPAPTVPPPVVVDDDDGTTFTLVPGQPITIPAAEITIIPGADLPDGTSTGVSITPSEPTGSEPTGIEPTGREPAFAVEVADPSSTTCDDADVFACPPDAAAEPLSAARLRSSFQLLRARASETGGSETEGLELLRPGDEVTEIFVTGTLINANLEDAACLTNLEVPFDFPRAVVAASGDVFIAPPEDFEVQCFYVGVRSREASAAPGTASAAAGRFPDAAQTSSPPTSCEDTVGLSMTDTGPVMAFKDDVALCPGCWLVGGRDGVLFSWKHVDGLRLRVAAGDDVGDGAARCKPVA